MKKGRFGALIFLSIFYFTSISPLHQIKPLK